MCEPCDGERLAATRRVLDQIALSRALTPRIGHQPPDAIELLVAREDEEAPAIPPPLIVLLLNLMDELAHQVQARCHAPRPPPKGTTLGNRSASARRGDCRLLPNLPRLKGRNRVSGPASLVVT